MHFSRVTSTKGTKLRLKPGIFRSRPVFIWGCLLTITVSLLFWLYPHILSPLEGIQYDLMLRFFPNNRASDRVVIVDMDEKSLERYGQWPWPRNRVAELLGKIAEMKPAAIGLDMIFAEPDRLSVSRILKELGDTHRPGIRTTDILAGLPDNDRILAETLAQGPFVLSNKFHFTDPGSRVEDCELHPVSTAVVSTGTYPGSLQPPIPEGIGVLCNLPVLARQVELDGFLNFSPDADGRMRRLPLLIQHNGNIYTSLAMAVVLKARKNAHLVLKTHGPTLRSIGLGQLTVPVDPYGQMLIKFRGPSRRYDTFSAADILDGTISANRLRDRMIFVGTSATGLKDLLVTPFDLIFPGVEVHATVADNLVTGDFIAEPFGTRAAFPALVVLSGVILSLVIAHQRAFLGFGVLCLMAGIFWTASQQIFYRMGLFFSAVPPLTAMAGIYILLTVFKFRREEKQQIARIQELVLTQDIAIESMANLAERRDPETGGHIRRTRRYVRLLAEHLKRHESFQDFLTKETIDLLYKSAPLHDIGKVGIPDAILLKPEPLAKTDFHIMKTHSAIGRDVIASSAKALGTDSFLNLAAEIAYSHHERWDGSGYPQGLTGDAIPISGRLMALADVYDALISRRVYKPPFSHAQAVDIIQKGRGTQFDPDVVDAFLEVQDQFKAIALQYADSPEEKQALETKNVVSGD